MAKLLENQSKEILRDFGIPIPAFGVAASAADAAQEASKLGKPVAVKALVPVGKRGKAGAVKFADTPEQAATAAQQLLGMTVSQYPVKKVIVEEKVVIEQEWYVAITYDPSKLAPVIIVSTMGGIDIEEVSRRYPDKVRFYHVDPLRGFMDYQAREIMSDLGVSGKLMGSVATLITRLYRAFDHLDATILEVNPLAVTESGELVAAGILMGVDDNAVFRQAKMKGKIQLGTERAWKPLTALEKKMVEVQETEAYRGTARYTEMPGGDIGFMCGGGGGSLLFFDVLLSMGGKLANYSEVGGNPPEEKVYGLTKGILSKPGVKGLFAGHNITNNTQVDIVAKGMVRALKDLGIDPKRFPVVVREAGVNDAVARQVFTDAGVEYYGDDVTMSEAAARMIKRMRETYGEKGGDR